MFSADQLRRIAGARNMPRHAEALAAAARKHMPAYGITNKLDIAAAWAIFATETGGFKVLEENLSYSAKRLVAVWPSRFKSLSAAKPYARNPQKLANKVYGARLGNRGKTDAGWLYRGSGPIQTTGFSNFDLVEKLSGLPVTSNPDLLRKNIDAGMQAACIFWQKRKCTAPAIKGDIRRVRKIVNGGYIGMEHVEKFYKRALRIVEKEGFEGASVDGVDGVDVISEPAPKPEDAQKSYPANPKSRILPLYRPKQSDDITQAVLAKFSHLMPADRRLDDVKVLVVRGYFENSMGKKGANDRAVYDDAVFVVTPDGVQPFNGNSDPSAYRKRIATIKAMQAVRYRPGPHGYKRKGGPYPAFRQDANCTVVRDGIGDDKGMFHVNFHRGGVNGTSSLGCLTIPPHQWDEFHALVSGLLKSHDQDTFYATVLEYAGGKPPVIIPEKPKSTTPAPKTTPGKSDAGVTTVAVVAVGGLVATWWDKITTFLTNLF